MDIVTYGLLISKIKSAGTGIADITKRDGYIIFTMDDGREFRIKDDTKDIIDVDIDNENYIVVTYEDGTSTKSDTPIPYPPDMTGATEEEDGTVAFAEELEVLPLELDDLAEAELLDDAEANFFSQPSVQQKMPLL